MTDTPAGGLLRTVLHDWHQEQGAKMVDFGGWRMPVQYPTGIIAEHLATRRGAGLFDVCHMGRFRITGAGAEAYLRHVLSNDAAALDSGQAHYTFIANEDGGAVDDAYLYKLDAHDYLLVVNASNRDKDWRWLRGYADGRDLRMVDASEERGMIALQGPRAAEILGRVIAPSDLPGEQRNRLGTGRFAGSEMLIARTGYTGEAVCFELFPERACTVELWQRLVDAGASPVGLGARDSLRLEAGLPLYGHELGLISDGQEIPVFANALARFAVRAPGAGEFVGHAALTAQREEFMRIHRGELDTPVEQRILTHLVHSIVIREGRRPLRAGYMVNHNGEPSGEITSGGIVPVPDAGAPEGYTLMPRGLALVRSDIRPGVEAPALIEVADARGNVMAAQLAGRNAWMAAWK